jgi:hypothetical protein
VVNVFSHQQNQERVPRVTPTENDIMRRLLTCSLLLLCSASSFAADRWRVSVLAAEISTDKRELAGSTAWADDAHAGVALGIAYVPAPQWDVELTVASQRHRSPYTRLFYLPMYGQPGLLTPVTEFREYRVMPVDLSVTRHFLTDRAVAPYVRAGVRHVTAPNDPPSLPVATPPTNVPAVQVSEGYGLHDRTSAQAGAGVRIRLTPRTALRAEATRLIRSEESDFDPLLRYALGLSWVF